MSEVAMHVCDLTNPDHKCQICGVHIPPICVLIEVFDGAETLVNEGFNCSDRYVAAAALRRAADKVERGI